MRPLRKGGLFPFSRLYLLHTPKPTLSATSGAHESSRTDKRMDFISVIPTILVYNSMSPPAFRTQYLSVTDQMQIGAFLGCCVNAYNQLLYNKAYHAAGDRPVPEKRLYSMFFGGIAFCAGQFITGWAPPTVHWMLPCFGLVLLGTGFFCVFQSAINYLVDTFQQNAASAIGQFPRCPRLQGISVLLMTYYTKRPTHFCAPASPVRSHLSWARYFITLESDQA